MARLSRLTALVTDGHAALALIMVTLGSIEHVLPTSVSPRRIPRIHPHSCRETQKSEDRLITDTVQRARVTGSWNPRQRRDPADPARCLGQCTTDDLGIDARAYGAAVRDRLALGPAGLTAVCQHRIRPAFMPGSAAASEQRARREKPDIRKAREAGGRLGITCLSWLAYHRNQEHREPDRVGHDMSSGSTGLSVTE